MTSVRTARNRKKPGVLRHGRARQLTLYAILAARSHYKSTAAALRASPRLRSDPSVNGFIITQQQRKGLPRHKKVPTNYSLSTKPGQVHLQHSPDQNSDPHG